MRVGLGDEMGDAGQQARGARQLRNVAVGVRRSARVGGDGAQEGFDIGRGVVSIRRY
jgi:hypothetical protein